MLCLNTQEMCWVDFISISLLKQNQIINAAKAIRGCSDCISLSLLSKQPRKLVAPGKTYKGHLVPIEHTDPS